MKNTIIAHLAAARILICLTVLCFCQDSPGAISLGQGELAFEAALTAIYDSNIFTNSSEEEDFLCLFTPGLRFRRVAGWMQMDAGAGVEFGRFADYSDNNYEDIQTNLSLSFPHRLDKTYFNRLAAGYNQISEANPDVGTRTERHEWFVEDDFRYEFSDKFGLRVLPAYLYSDARSRGLLDRAVGTAGLRFLYIYSSKLDLELGYRYRRTEVEKDGLNTADHAILAGATGQLLPKITGSIAAGAQNRTFEDSWLNDETSPYLSLELVWDSQHKSVITLLAERDFDTTDNSLSLTRTRVALEFAYAFTSYLQGSLGGEAAFADYTARRDASGQALMADRKDDIYSAHATLLYEIGDWAEVSCRVQYQNRDSSYALTDYEKLTFEVSGKIRF